MDIDQLVSKVEDILRPKGKKGLAGIFVDEHQLVEAARKTRALGIKKFEALSPHPVHGIDEAMGIKLSWIPWVTFIFGLTGCAFGTWFTWWTSAVDWPIIIAGKPMWSLPAFVPIMFECTILFAALSSVGVMIGLCRMPAIDPHIIDNDLTCHKFAIWVDEHEPGFDAAKLEALFQENGATEVRSAEF